MQRIIIILFIIFLVQNSPSSNSSFKKSIESSQNLKILTWNVQMLPSIGSLFSRDLRKMQKERTEWIIDHLSNEDYDIILLQESFDNDFIDQINARLAYKYPYQIEPYRPKWYKLSNGLMVLSRIPIRFADKITFTQSAQSDFFASKGAILFELLLDNAPYYIINTHLQADYENKKFANIRANQLDQIKEKLIDKYLLTDDKIIVAGDFNVEENIKSQEYNNLIKKFNFKDLVYEFFKMPTISFDKHNFWNTAYYSSCRLDYFLTNLTNPLSVKIQKPKRMFNNEEVDLADHYGISLEISLI